MNALIFRLNSYNHRIFFRFELQRDHKIAFVEIFSKEVQKLLLRNLKILFCTDHFFLTKNETTNIYKEIEDFTNVKID